MKMEVVAPAVAVAKAEKLASRLVAANRTNRARQDLVDRGGPPRFASYLDENQRPSPRLTVPREKAKTEKHVVVLRTRSAKSP